MEENKHEENKLEEGKLEEGKLEENTEGVKGVVMEWLKSIVLAIVIAFIIKTFIMDPTKVVGSSMENTLHSGDRLILNKIVLKIRPVNRRDIVVIKYDEKDDYIKRVVGLPGEFVQLIQGKIFINGEELEEDYINGDYTEAINGFEWKLGSDEYFVCGDNRLPGKSKDSRDFGPVKLDRIKGIASFRFYPFGKSFGSLE